MQVSQTTQALLDAVREHQRQTKRSGQPPLDPNQAGALRERVFSTFRYELPQAYLDLLNVTDGLDLNGIQFYASTPKQGVNDYFLPGLLEANMQLRLGYEPAKNYVFFAESGMDAYRHNLRENTFEISDRGAEDSVFERFETADELFQQMLNYMLGNYPDDEEDPA